ATDSGSFERQRKKDIGVANDIMIEKVSGCGAEIGEIDRPAVYGNGQSDFVLFVPFSMQWQKCLVIIQIRISHSDQRWRLIVATIKPAQYPIHTRNANGCSNARIGSIFALRACIVSEPDAAI